MPSKDPPDPPQPPPPVLYAPHTPYRTPPGSPLPRRRPPHCGCAKALEAPPTGAAHWLLLPPLLYSDCNAGTRMPVGGPRDRRCYRGGLDFLPPRPSPQTDRQANAQKQIVRPGPPSPKADMATRVVLVSPLFQATDPPAPRPDPTRTKLTTLETKRVMAVLDEAVQKVEVATLLSYVAANLDGFRGQLGEELSQAVRIHEELAGRLGGEDESPRALPSPPDPPRPGPRSLRQELKGSTRGILRLFMARPEGTAALRAQAHGRHPAAQALIDHLAQLRGFVFEKLLTGPSEEREKRDFTREVARRARRNSAAILALEGELDTMVQTRNAEVEKENLADLQLKSQLQLVLKFSQTHLHRSRQDAEKLQKSALRASQGRCAKIQQDILVQRTQANTLVSENREIEGALRKKKYKLETEIENWIQKYDGEMGEKQTELEELQAIYAEEKAQLAELQEKHGVLRQEYAQITEERQVTSKKKLEEERELIIMVRAATLIQAFWKGYLIRSLLKSKRKKKKGKGKK
ncbi:dynein regulatory complex protein 10 [Tachyglossus aculeatus]|uniref:dynein regulatory complex protein 10 n=1 Tax=Tachyglossus aculeatus TaxID=9261 RepID=UPI0018F3155E|nr:dynein regulatory complex protein 10 [Tachyglossus aculeatus]